MSNGVPTRLRKGGPATGLTHVERDMIIDELLRRQVGDGKPRQVAKVHWMDEGILVDIQETNRQGRRPRSSPETESVLLRYDGPEPSQ